MDGNSLCTLSGDTWTCTVTVQTTAEGQLSARQNGDTLESAVTGTVYVANSCTDEAAQYISQTLERTVEVSALSVIRDAISVTVHEDGGKLIGSSMIPDYTAVRWRSDIENPLTAKLPWNTSYEVMPLQEQNHTLKMKVDRPIQSLKFKRDAWTGSLIESTCVQRQVNGLGDLLEDDFVEAKSCSSAYSVTYDGTTVSGTLAESADVLQVDIGNVCNGKLFEEETDPMLFEFTQGGTDVKTLRIIIECGPGAVQLGLQSFADSSSINLGENQLTAYSLRDRRKYIMRNPFTHMKFHLIQTGTGMNPNLDFFRSRTDHHRRLSGTMSRWISMLAGAVL